MKNNHAKPAEAGSGAPEIRMTDPIGSLTPAQIDHLSLGLEHAHDMRLKDALCGRYWLECIGEGGALLVQPSRTVAQVWQCAKSINAEAEKHP